jgi:hypothetical protein
MSQSLEPAQYIEESGVAMYLRDVVRLLLAQRTEKPLLFIHEYFQGVLKGENVVLREFGYVNSTSRNRLSFIINFEKAYKQMGEEAIPVDDYHQLLVLLCPDFPRVLVDRTISMMGADVANPPLFSKLSQAVQICFFYSGLWELPHALRPNKNGIVL